LKFYRAARTSKRGECREREREPRVRLKRIKEKRNGKWSGGGFLLLVSLTLILFGFNIREDGTEGVIRI